MDHRIQKAARERGYRTPSAFIRAAIEGELKQRGDTSSMEEQTAASFDRVVGEMHRVLRGQQALFALVDALTKAFLTCVPEPPSEARATSIAVARDRYARLLKTAGTAMASESRSAMQGLVANVEE
jgi:hypothetical protein